MSSSSPHHHVEHHADAHPEPVYRAPQRCPVCADHLHVTRLGCPGCGTALSGEFRPCEFCGLDDADLGLLRVFLTSRGNLRDVERHLGVSYPTARARFDDLLRKLGWPPTTSTGTPVPTESAEDPRLETLRALAGGGLDVDTARQRLTGQR